MASRRSSAWATLVLFMVVPLAQGGEEEGGAVLRRGTLFLSTSLVGYMNNLEYFNAYRQGVLHLGTNVTLRALYRPVEGVAFSLGGFARKAAGDGRLLSDARFLPSVRFRRGVFTLTMGELDATGRHGLPDAVVREQYEYEKGFEEGFSLRWEWPLVGWELWMVCDSLNTARHREHLRFGSVTRFASGMLHARLMGYWDHYGGQLHAPQGDPVRDNWTGGVRAGVAVPVARILDRAGLDVTALGSSTTQERNRIDYVRGWVAMMQARLERNRFELLWHTSYGNRFIAWQGNPLYGAPGFWHALQLSRSAPLAPGLMLDWGVRADVVDLPLTRWAERADHQVWIRIGSSQERLLY